MTGLLDSLVRAVGATHVLTDESDLRGRDCDGRGPAGRALAFVRPADAGEVGAVLRIAHAAGVRVVPQGARTGLVAGGTADDTGAMILLGLDRLAGPPQIDPVNRSATVGAGVLLSTLNAAAARFGLCLAIDLGADPMIGGMVAANTGGARFLRYGGVRRNILGIQAVTSDGATVALGGALWKDNAGLDLKQMLIGAAGALGIVTQVTVALQPVPVHAVTAIVALRDATAATDLLLALERHCGTLLTAFEGMSANAVEAALAHVPSLRRPSSGAGANYHLLIELSAGAAIDASQLEEMLAAVVLPLAEDDGPVLDVAIDRGTGLWALRHAVPEGLRAMGAVVGCDIALRRGDVMRFRAEVGAAIAMTYPELVLCDFGHIGDGGLHFNLVWPTSAGTPPAGRLEAARADVFAAVVEQFGGSFSAEHGIGPRNHVYYRRWTPPAVRALAGRVQSAFAPQPLGRVDFGLAEQETLHVD